MSILKTDKITKMFPGTTALDNVSVSFESGTIHALVGKNGSGKSTLLKVFSGAYQPTRGKVLLDGIPVKFNDPSDAFAKGIATVYQELSLIPSLTVAENIFMGRLPMRGRFVDWNRAYTMAQELLEEMKVDIDAHQMVYKLSMWQCQMIEIVKAMSFNPKVLLLDEPTSALAQHETQSLFKIIRQLKKKDVIIIYVSHRLQELWQIADKCSVLRDGKLIGTVSMDEATHKDIVNMMFGNVKVQSRPRDLEISDKVILEVKNLTRAGYFKDISLKLRKGEILGIAGMLGAGRTELLKSIFGADPFDSGEIIYDGNKIISPNPEKMKKAGIALTPEDRKVEGLIQLMSIKNNLSIASIDLISKGAFIDKHLEQQFAKRQVEDLDIKVSDIELPVSSLSGGNQQKVVIGNWLNTTPKVMFFDEPSRGIDVKTKQQVFQIIWEQSRKGIASIMVSSELEELLEVCHRILVLHQGEIIKELVPENIKIEDLYLLCMGGEQF